MTRTRAKICGITRAADALAVVNAGADAIGLVFYPPSPRAVDITQAAAIVAMVPAFVTVTALFVNPTSEQVQSVLDVVRIDLIQFHGDEDDGFCQQFNRPYIKAVRVRQASDMVEACVRFPGALSLLLDSYKPGVPGGTGETFDWSLVPDDLNKPIILAGGLSPDNVATAIRDVHPFAVDVSGGVEANGPGNKGIKDASKIQAFMNEVYRVNYEQHNS
ncbi:MULTISPECIES: phosphoribosylanthranilate isomerase [unclassified Oceanobacter]|uniref:phosphoribosylanthranilate isomerase n=1 Tax=unclassified Oceanobacter TaxID=2620260 RepID=UPI0026E2F5DB|nr:MULTISPECIES: phosphoribosylanthranilate isomerase [unclassified Oceanobacter]MDO6683460.1 phosphoribosylanthranilate isomerase [Oceanobacter sp. 5_MG-2023]MDP2507068.1 phosphoribosylanthranilate isomerase [Oceanobacter sp. 3_MG-2023]MDP2609589.1 phosphoribosylanthranilate isomerase [Oceanobacter sp. 1_MG-2023]MDP2612672.1 phosphoribosylanthranilate isomerase [Oceanobacter sp. 2_MG-2023]